eukprot:TRINITY_DN432_c0_g1_i10.p1 TRINITY_DN432_c0_g1~~TRINITY_DN432_c0_g1_i10.p1  ORF type:complete len:1066 (+),score=290.38 TRINITY_DN432_c0_g1_i10:319-3516(+)
MHIMESFRSNLVRVLRSSIATFITEFLKETPQLQLQQQLKKYDKMKSSVDQLNDKIRGRSSTTAKSKYDTLNKAMEKQREDGPNLLTNDWMYALIDVVADYLSECLEYFRHGEAVTGQLYGSLGVHREAVNNYVFTRSENLMRSGSMSTATPPPVPATLNRTISSNSLMGLIKARDSNTPQVAANVAEEDNGSSNSASNNATFSAGGLVDDGLSPREFENERQGWLRIKKKKKDPSLEWEKPRWASRFLVLRQNHLFVFRYPEDKNCSRMISLVHCTLETSNDDEFCFMVRAPLRNHVFAVNMQHDLNRWREGIQIAINANPRTTNEKDRDSLTCDSTPPQSNQQLQTVSGSSVIEPSSPSPGHKIEEEEDMTPPDAKESSSNRPLEVKRTSGKLESRQKQLLRKFLVEERDYIDNMSFITTYINAIKAKIVPRGSWEEEMKQMFFNIEDILHLHFEFWEDLESVLQKWPSASISAVFIRRLPLFEAYEAYRLNFKEAMEIFERNRKQNKPFQNLLKTTEASGSGASLASLLSAPALRNELYRTFLEELLHEPQEEGESEKLQFALSKFQELGQDNNKQSSNLAKIARIAVKLQDCDEVLVKPGRELLKDGILQLVSGTNKLDYYFCLFSDILVYAKKISKSKYRFSGKFVLYNFSLKDTMDETSFQLVENLRFNKTNKTTLCCQSLVKKQEWLEALNLVFTRIERKKQFSVPLQQMMENEDTIAVGRDIPTFIEKTINFLYERVEQMEGIFRHSGRNTTIEAMKNSLNQGNNVYYTDQTDLHSVAELLKMWFRDLPEPILTFDLNQAFLDSLEIEDKEQRIEHLRKTVEKLPKVNKGVTQQMMRLLRRIADCTEQTRMNFSDLGIIFGPSMLSTPLVVGPGPPNRDMYKKACDVIQFLIENYQSIFLEVERERINLREGRLQKEKELAQKVRDMIDSEENSAYKEEERKQIPKLGQKSSGKMSGRISLVNCTIGTSSRKENCFCISTYHNSDNFFFVAGNAQERELWISSIQSCIEEDTVDLSQVPQLDDSPLSSSVSAVAPSTNTLSSSTSTSVSSSNTLRNS